MASQALYRRYRSQTFSELVGQEHIVQTLRNALSDGRVAHAYLFTGPRGVGKTSTARLLAKAVNCTAAMGERPCGECGSCVAVAEGHHVDVIEMDAASHTSVEDAREIIERVQFRPSIGTYKVYVIDEVHMLSTAAFNALLKTLEEPPGHALFILATTEIHKVPATILSRCQKFTFSRHTIASTAAHLHSVAQIEGFTLELGVAESIARAATGSMRDALSVLDQLMSYGNKTISVEQVQGLLGTAESQEVVVLVDALIANDLSGALKAVAGVVAQGADLRQFARDLVEHLRELMLLKAGGDTGLIDAGEDELAVLQQQAQDADLGALLQWVKLFSGLDHQIRTSTIPQLPLEMAVVEALARPAALAAVPAAADRRPAAVSRRPPTEERRAAAPVVRPPTTEQRPPADRQAAATGQGIDIQARPTTNNEHETTGQGSAENDQVAPNQPLVENWDVVGAKQVEGPNDILPPAPEVEPVGETEDETATFADAELTVETPISHENSEKVAQENAAVIALEQIEMIWPEVIRDVRVHDKMVQALLNSGVRPVDVEGNIVVLEVASDFFLNKLNQPSTRQTVERVLKKLTNIDYFIRPTVKEQHIENQNVLREQIRTSRKDPLVKAAINIFDAEIVAVESTEE